jgi:predicted ThiF/HesA family dinucleotide-utilizing enzyme
LLASAGVVAVAVIAAVLVANHRGGAGRLAVSIVLEKATIHVGGTDRAVVVNNSRF